MGRIQSPSSINMYRQCPRRYFYQYILKLPTSPSIHLVRGSAVHDALETFFQVKPEQLGENPNFELKTLLHDFFRQAWEKREGELAQLDMSKHDILFYYSESKKMLDNWLNGFLERVEEQDKPFKEAFAYLTPVTEKHYHSSTYKVRGFIDAIHHFEDGVHIFDYKTSSRDHLSPEYRLQLAIYALLYKVEHGTLPKRVGINFLKFGEKYLAVDESLVEEAREAIKDIHQSTQSTEKKDYPKKIGPLCKWSTGQCDFYETCIKDD